MNAERLKQAIEAMDPEEALTVMAAAVKQLFLLLGEEARLNFIVNLVGDAGTDKVSSLVHL